MSEIREIAKDRNMISYRGGSAFRGRVVGRAPLRYHKGRGMKASEIREIAKIGI